tara:strand:+ start:29086 stop:29412 length:327 start_codon:yes stop_codon:yes gene_type:complete
MKLSVIAVMTTASLGLFAGSALAQTEASGDVVAPTMEECVALHERVLGDVAPHDAAAREAALVALDESTGAEMKACLALMEGPNEAAVTQAEPAGDKPDEPAADKTTD